MWGNRERYPERTEKVGGYWRSPASCSGRTKLATEQNRIMINNNDNKSIYTAQFVTNSIPTALYIVIKYIQT